MCMGYINNKHYCMCISVSAKNSGYYFKEAIGAQVCLPWCPKFQTDVTELVELAGLSECVSTACLKTENV